MISKEWQHRGLGFHLFSKMCEIAHEKGVSALIGDFMKANIGVDRILKNLPYSVGIEDCNEVFEFKIDLRRKKPS